MQGAKLCPPKMDPEQLQVVPYAAWGRAWGDAVHGSASV